MLVKLCGFTEAETVKIAVEQKCDFLGFVFFDKSPRNISPQKAGEISVGVPANIKKVAVVVNPEMEFLEEISQKFSPDFFQFHGSETSNFLENVRQQFPKTKIIKAFRISSTKDLEQVKDYEDYADFFLFDAKVENEFGGSGKKFDWEILKNFHSKKDWFLSGGLNEANIDEALKITGAKIVDVSSGIEFERGKKSPELIKKFMSKIRILCS